MTEEKEDSVLPDDEDVTMGLDAHIRVSIPTEMKVRVDKKCSQECISRTSFVRNALEALIEEDERVDFLIERSETTDVWENWKEYLLDQKEQDEEQFEKFTREEIDSIFEAIEEERNE